ncbi:hypothetical protein [Pararhizobium sp. DWP3-4]|uniref:hypothetical protein n=1 Tax=Pararhizobium sp. DWP3-4 TaxID=2804565 RepID=UPI003CF86DC4
MVRLDMEGDGIVHLHLGPPHAESDEAAYFAALETIGALTGAYVMVVDISGHFHLSRDGEIRQAQWAKATRAQVSSCCRALALVRDKPNPRSQQSFARLWQIPVHVTSDLGEAMEFARTHLCQERPQA